MRTALLICTAFIATNAASAENTVAKLGLKDGFYCKVGDTGTIGDDIIVSAKGATPYIGIDGLDCHDPFVSGGRLIAKTCYGNGGIKLDVSKTFSASGDRIRLDDVEFVFTPAVAGKVACEHGAAAIPAAARSEDAEEPAPYMSANHNGSEMELTDTKIIYSQPKASLRGVVKPGTVLVQGKWNGDRFTGTAYAFKKGCAPAPYPVSGTKVEKPGQLDLVLRGAGPIRKGCEVVGYSDKSPHTRLVFDQIMSN